MKEARASVVDVQFCHLLSGIIIVKFQASNLWKTAVCESSLLVIHQSTEGTENVSHFLIFLTSFLTLYHSQINLFLDVNSSTAIGEHELTGGHTCTVPSN